MFGVLITTALDITLWSVWKVGSGCYYVTRYIVSGKTITSQEQIIMKMSDDIFELKHELKLLKNETEEYEGFVLV